MLQEIITKIEQSVQCIVLYIINLCFQPIYAILAIIQGIIPILKDNEEEETEQQPQQTVTTYPSTNEGKYAEECDYPIGRQRIGFHINQNEQYEIKRIKEELNKK